jgi:hypothetical protein
MDLCAEMGGDQSDDALDLGRLDPHLGIDAAFAEPVEAQGTVGIDHDLDDLGIAHGGGDVLPKRRDEHAPATLG